MRPIKFRAWNKKTNQMIDQINEIEFDNSCCESIPHTVSFDFFNGNFDTEVWHKDDFILLQFTGLQDKNGVDIYEGDILINDLGRVCEVRWHEHQAGFDCEFIKDTNYQKDTDMTLGFRNVHLHIFTEIIGNKFESPDLLEQ